MFVGDSPDALSPSSPCGAGRNSPVDSPRTYRIGSTSPTFGECRMYGGRILLVNRWRSPCSFRRRSFTGLPLEAPGMSRVGDCWDNAVAESFFATLKTELIHRRPCPTKAEARSAVHDYIGAFFNPHRRHSSLGYVSPMDFERQHAAATVAA